MSNVLIFPPSDCAVEWIDGGQQLTEPDAKRAEIQLAIRDIAELRAKAKVGLDDVIAALEQGHVRLRQAVRLLESHSVRAKLQEDLALLEQLFERAKSDLSKFWPRNF